MQGKRCYVLIHVAHGGGLQKGIVFGVARELRKPTVTHCELV
jgi:hypothetical protein